MNRLKESLRTAAVAVPLFLAGCIAYTPGAVPSPFDPKPSPTQPAQKGETPQLLSNEQVVLEEALRLGLDSNENERMLWQRSGYKFDPLFAEKFPTPEAIITQADIRIHTVLELMYNSENRIFKKAALDFANLRAVGRANFYLRPDKEHFERQSSNMETSPQIVDYKIAGYIHLSARETLNAKSDIILAIELSHEIEHIRNIVQAADVFDRSLTTEEKFDKIEEQRNNRQAFLAEEARGYAEQAGAYIIAYGHGYRGAVDTSHERLAAAFIKSGKRKDSKEWLAFVEYYMTLVSQTGS